MSYQSELGDELMQLWAEQIAYNDVIRSLEGLPMSHDKDYWTSQYLLGLVSEVDEVLREVSWKRHRKLDHKEPIRRNVALELADLTKYVLSLWEVWGFRIDEVIDWCNIKSRVMRSLLVQEGTVPKEHQPILITDIDGTLGDWRKSFLDWYKKSQPDARNYLQIDLDLVLNFPEYNKLKDEFEANGGYASIYPLGDGISLVQKAKDNDVFVIAFTARPANKFKHILYDTMMWLQYHDIEVDQLEIGADQRILRARALMLEGHPVAMLEDDPILIYRASTTGINVTARRQPYNKPMQDQGLPLVRWVDNYDEVEDIHQLWDDYNIQPVPW